AALVLPDADDQSWAKIALDTRAWASMPGLVAGLPISARVVVCNALRLAVADAELDPAQAVEIVAALLAHEPDEAIIAATASWAGDVLVDTYLAPGTPRQRAENLLVGALSDLLDGTAPSSGRQLAAARAMITVAADVAMLRRWLSGDVPTGIELDTDLRWSLLRRLAGLGELSTVEINAELERDNSTAGAVHAARCRAARPDPQGKQDAWQALMTDPDRSNYELYALAEGFWHPAQTELTAPYAERYFAEIARTATLRSGMVVSRVAMLAYPWTAVTPATVSATEALLALPNLDEHIHRSVIDAGDDLRRAVRSRARFA
ncbi:MAG: ERAP1-like C-terminal domain-containing protein, partial [Jatrophihabitantaceae bacterium]